MFWPCDVKLSKPFSACSRTDFEGSLRYERDELCDSHEAPDFCSRLWLRQRGFTDNHTASRVSLCDVLPNLVSRLGSNIPEKTARAATYFQAVGGEATAYTRAATAFRQNNLRAVGL